MADKLGVMLCGHGSRDADAVREFAVLASRLKQRLPHYPVEYGYLEFATPIIRSGLDSLSCEALLYRGEVLERSAAFEEPQYLTALRIERSRQGFRFDQLLP